MPGPEYNPRRALPDNWTDMIVHMSEGNPGGISVLCQLAKRDMAEGTMAIIEMDDMNIRGSQVWAAYKDFCDEDLDKLLLAVRERNESMVEKVNEICAYPGEYRAITFGASRMPDRESLLVEGEGRFDEGNG